MSRIPPNLLYLTIYNSTLQPIGTTSEDEEDAEEQAHILFYTSKERAVSRDRMLRQVGLAKALVNFSDMFTSTTDMCNNVHSQSKRLIMVSPEPDYWIHAGIEVAKVPRVPPEKGKGKGHDRQRHTEKGKEKEKGSDSTPLFDYQEGSVHDLALRSDILRGYERFKLTHGSFTSNLTNIGREALELQLERFFTVWAWSWNLEDGSEFTDHLGTPLHPLFRTLNPILDGLSDQFPRPVASLFIQPPYIVPSSKYSTSLYPTSIPHHLLSLMPPIPFDNHSSDSPVNGRRPSNDTPTSTDTPKDTPEISASTFFGIPTANINVNMDVKKWNWPGYLTFSKGPAKRSGLEEVKMPVAAQDVSDTSTSFTKVVSLDKSALEDAFSDNLPAVVITDDPKDAELPPSNDESNVEVPTASMNVSHVSHIRNPANIEIVSSGPLTPPTPITESPPPPAEKPLLQLSSASVYLADPANPLLTRRQKIYYISHDQKMLALVGLEQDPLTSVPHIVHLMSTILEDIDVILLEELSKTITLEHLPSAQKILQPTDTHIISSGLLTISSPNFSSKSGYLYNVQELQTMDPEISEVFSRGLNPQHWHIARKGVDTDIFNQGLIDKEEVYMQIFRKEASLSDVDNVLTGVTRRNGFVDGPT